MRMRTSELTDAALDWAVARCKHIPVRIMEIRGVKVVAFESNWNPAAYHDDWSQGGPIIEREKLDVVYQAGGRGDEWTCFANDIDDKLNSIEAGGPTPLIAAMRCYVASCLGDEVDIPEELV